MAAGEVDRQAAYHQKQKQHRCSAANEHGRAYQRFGVLVWHGVAGRRWCDLRSRFAPEVGRDVGVFPALQCGLKVLQALLAPDICFGLELGVADFPFCNLRWPLGVVQVRTQSFPQGIAGQFMSARQAFACIQQFAGTQPGQGRILIATLKGTSQGQGIEQVGAFGLSAAGHTPYELLYGTAEVLAGKGAGLSGVSKGLLFHTQQVWQHGVGAGGSALKVLQFAHQKPVLGHMPGSLLCASYQFQGRCQVFWCGGFLPARKQTHGLVFACAVQVIGDHAGVGSRICLQGL
ncbi:MAG: hypothetical protein IPP14_12920 [Planctomycetes bacterium]|nr:hypothetical protein [Planctomycetota bacterium]